MNERCIGIAVGSCRGGRAGDQISTIHFIEILDEAFLKGDFGSLTTNENLKHTFEKVEPEIAKPKVKIPAISKPGISLTSNRSNFGFSFVLG